VLEIKSVSKSFPGVKALYNVSMAFNENEIHALLGENGAGKSTLINIMCGVYKPDEGEIFLDGRALALHDFKDAIDRRISLVSQEIQVIPLSTVAENIMLDKLYLFKKSLAIDWKKLKKEASKYMQIVGLNVPPNIEIGRLSTAQKQLALIAKALSADAKVLLLDEPTSSLTSNEVENLFRLLRKLKSQGVVIVFVSHKLEEVLEICDVVTVLRDGRCVGTRAVEGLLRENIVNMMIGRNPRDEWRGYLKSDRSAPVFELQNLTSKLFKNISLKLYKGEILGLYGLVGSGRTELAKTVIGEYPYESGQIIVKGQKAKITSVHDSLQKYRIGYISENRREEGLILSASVNTNVNITIWKRLASRITRFISPRKEFEQTMSMIQKLDIRTPSPMQIVNNLSGGNQQKVSISKSLVADCDILILDEPTIGVDVGAKEYIHDLIWKMANDEGKSIILISSEMAEMIDLARRILVFRDFRIAGELEDLNERHLSYEEISERIGMYLT
jgi:ribose transport system ATP-binding protein